MIANAAVKGGRKQGRYKDMGSGEGSCGRDVELQSELVNMAALGVVETDSR